MFAVPLEVTDVPLICTSVGVPEPPSTLIFPVPTIDSLFIVLNVGVPSILLYQN